jgi:hypothetical protein
MNQEMVIYLIKQDLRHIQLLRLLEKLGFDIENFYLDILAPVAELMGVPEDKISDQLAYVYDSYMNEAENYPITGRGEHLDVLATQCYEMIQKCIVVEKRAEDFMQ